MRRLLLWSAAALLLLVAMLVGGAWWVSQSDSGLPEADGAGAAFQQRHAAASAARRGGCWASSCSSDVHYPGADGLRVDAQARASAPACRASCCSIGCTCGWPEVASGLDVWLAPLSPKTSTSSETQLPSRLPLDLIVDAFSLEDFQLHQPAVAGAAAARPFRIPGGSARGQLGPAIRWTSALRGSTPSWSRPGRCPSAPASANGRRPYRYRRAEREGPGTR